MLYRINLQFLLSYLGILPFIIILLDKFFLSQLNQFIMKDFIIIYSLIIFVFIGALNWNLKKNVSNKSIFIGFVPSLISVIIVLLYLYSYEVLQIIIICFLAQLFLDNYNFKEKIERAIFFKVRAPLTLLVVLSLLFIQL